MGFQQTLLEYARNVLNIKSGSHEEINPDSELHIISRLSCSLVGESQTIRVLPESIAFHAYGKDSVVEKFKCNYGLNEEFRNDLNDGKLKITGFDMDENARILEIPDHRFFAATLFLPQISSKPGSAHPLILSFIKSVIEF